jgi:hypothetical protein
VRYGFALCLVLFVAACNAAPPATTSPTATPTPFAATPSPTTAPTATATPTSQPSQASASFDPTKSDAGVSAVVTISNVTRGDRNGTFTIYGVAADGSDCSYSFDGTEYGAVAWFDAAPNGQIHHFSVTIPASDVPAAAGSKTGISGRVSLDFVSPSGFGTTYSGDASETNSGQSTINVTRTSNSLTFDFTGTTWDNVKFAGTMVCEKAGLAA